MRRTLALFGMILASTLAGPVTAEPAAPAPTTPHPPAPGTTVRIVKITNLTQPAAGDPAGSYRGGPVEVAVDLENIGPAATTVTLRVKHDSFVFSKAITVPPRTTAATTPVTFTEPGGVDESCTPHQYGMSLEGEGADTRLRLASLVPTCTWSGAVEDAWGGQTTEAVRRRKAFISSVDVVSGPTCKTPAKLTVGVANHAEKPAPSLAVQVKVGDDVRGTSPSIAVPSAGKGSVTVQSLGGEAPPDPRLWLVDPSSAFTSEIANRAIAVKWRRMCRLAVTQVS